MKRPLKFAEVIGQEIPIKLIKNGLMEKKLPRAIIFHGSSGIGKTTLARLVAAWAFCQNKADDDVCGECEQCRGVQSGGVPDLIEFDAASHTSIEDIREILELCNYVPQVGTEKVFIIDEAHMLSRNAISALLKTLEEAHDGIRFILATTEIDKISNAIRSRCFCVPLQDLSVEEINQCLVLAAKDDDIEIDKESCALIARVSYGSMRESLSVFYRAALLNKKVTIDVLKSILSYLDDVDLEKIALLLMGGDYVALYEELLFLCRERKLFGMVAIRQLIDYYRELYVSCKDKNLVLQIIIKLNRLYFETLKTSLFNEITIISLCEIAYDLREGTC